MRKVLEFVGVITVVQGLVGLLHEFTGRFRPGWLLVPRLDFLAGFEIVANCVLVVLGFVVLIASGRVDTPR
jgi:hypothetical protein